MIDLYQIAAIGLVAIFLWEVGKAIVKLVWEEVTSPREINYGPTHQAYRNWKKDLKKRNG